MKHRRGLTLIETAIALAFIAVLGIAIASFVRVFGIRSADAIAENRLEHALVQASRTIAAELRPASAATIELLDVDPVYGARAIAFRPVLGFNAAGQPTLGTKVKLKIVDDKLVRYDYNTAQNRTLVGLISPQNDPDGPGLSVDRPIAGQPKLIEFIVRARALDAETGEPKTRATLERVVLTND